MGERAERRRSGRGHVPLRTCAGCRAVRTKPELLRVATTPGGGATLDELGRLPGRGAYLCRSSARQCLEAARRRRALARTLRLSTAAIDCVELARRLGA